MDSGSRDHDTAAERRLLELDGRQQLGLHPLGLLLRRLHAGQRRRQPELPRHQLRAVEVRAWLLGRRDLRPVQQRGRLLLSEVSGWSAEKKET